MSTLVLAAQAAQQGGGMGGMLIMMVAIFAIMWFFMIRPQQKRQKKIRQFQNALKKGTKVVLGGGIYGAVKTNGPAKNTVEVEVAHNVVLTVDKGYVFADVAQQQPNA